jgi:hypothetical protein
MAPSAVGERTEAQEESAEPGPPLLGLRKRLYYSQSWVLDTGFKTL